MSINSAEREPVVTETMDQAIGRRVHELMWGRRVTARTLAPQLGVDPSGLGRRLRGERGWSSDEIFAAARYFEVPVGQLFGEGGPERPTTDYKDAVSPAGVLVQGPSAWWRDVDQSEDGKASSLSRSMTAGA